MAACTRGWKLLQIHPFMPSSRNEILRELASDTAALADLERARDKLQARIAALRTELAATGAPTVNVAAPTNSASGTASPQTPAEKVKLFLSLFRGRTDVFPIRFVSKKTGRAGYAPACSNKWLPEICLLKSGGKCSDCTNQSFIPVDGQLIVEHLQGRHVMGVYPLLEDETCWFLAVDFDKLSWQEDVTAFSETCRSAHIPVAIERSRSGNGAHAWFFFAAPVSANIARRMGCYLITETMNRRHELSMESYDRLFPNQDTMPRGGFGNLIALPLQHEARQQGNSVFVNEGFRPFADQWAFLASVQRIQPTDVDLVAREATRTGQVVGVRIADTDDEESAPWPRLPAGRIHVKPVAGPLPPEVKAVLAQRLYIEKAGLPPPLLNQLKRIAAFQNPEFYKKQRMRLSTAMTPRVISCADELPGHISLPRGRAPDVAGLLAQHHVALRVDDKRHGGSSLPVAFRGELTAVQKKAARALLQHDTGIFVAPPGIGKTVLGTHLISQRACSALVLVHRKPLLEQWKAQLAMFLDIDEKNIGQIGGGQRKPNGRLDVAMMQSLVRKEGVDDLVGTYGHVIVDECHHVPAFSFERVLSEVKARYLVGLTATPQRRDGRQAITEMQLGPIRYRVDAKSQAARRPFEHKLIVRNGIPRACRADRQRYPGRLPLPGGRQGTQPAHHRRHHCRAPGGPLAHTFDRTQGSSRPPSRKVGWSRPSFNRVEGRHCQVKSARRHFNSWHRFRTRRSGLFWRLVVTLARASTTRASTRFSLPCRYPGREPWSSTQGACTGIIPANSKFEYTTTSIAKYRCCCACSKSG